LPRGGLNRDPFRHVAHREDEVRGRHRIDDLQAACRGSGPLFRQLTGATPSFPRPDPGLPARTLAISQYVRSELRKRGTLNLGEGDVSRQALVLELVDHVNEAV